MHQIKSIQTISRWKLASAVACDAAASVSVAPIQEKIEWKENKRRRRRRRKGEKTISILIGRNFSCFSVLMVKHRKERETALRRYYADENP